ncbi:hypothetical protein OKA06_00960 [Novosphingobium sp. MW5]|nr:hypothetical protein [Novosphingobium sp. MW5]
MAIDFANIRRFVRKRSTNHANHYNAGELSELDLDRYGFLKKSLIMAAYIPLFTLAVLLRLFRR